MAASRTIARPVSVFRVTNPPRSGHPSRTTNSERKLGHIVHQVVSSSPNKRSSRPSRRLCTPRRPIVTTFIWRRTQGRLRLVLSYHLGGRCPDFATTTCRRRGGGGPTMPIALPCTYPSFEQAHDISASPPEIIGRNCT